MMLSIEVLPAPFGPIMARISPLRISNETPATALTPPKASDTFSTASSTLPAAISSSLGALMRRLRKCDDAARATGSLCPLSHGERERTGVAARSCRFLHRRHRHRVHVADFDAGREHALAAVLERHLGGNVGLARTVIERRDQRRITLGDETAADLLGARDFAVVGVEFFMQNEKAPNLRPRHGALLRQRAVHLLYVLREHVVDPRMPRQLLIGAIDDIAALRLVSDRGEVDVQHRADAVALVAVDHGFADVGIEFELVLDVFRREQRTVVEAPNVLCPIDDLEMAGLGIDEAGIAGVHPSIGSLGLRSLLRVLVVAHEHAGRLEQHFAVLADLDVDADIRLADGVGVDLAVRLGGDVDRGLGLPVELLEVDAERAPEPEDFRPDCFAGRVTEADAGNAEPVLERPIHQKLAEPIEEPRI